MSEYRSIHDYAIYEKGEATSILPDGKAPNMTLDSIIGTVSVRTMARRKKQRVDPDAARRRFLDALAAQRANATRQKADSRLESKQVPPPVAVSLPGFYYDETTRRYFRSDPTSEHCRRHQLALHEPKRNTSVRPTTGKTCRLAYGGKFYNWVHYLRHRQHEFSWSAWTRDSRELIPLFFAGILVSFDFLFHFYFCRGQPEL